MTDAVVGLSESIEALRAELLKSVVAGHGQQMRFQLEPVELTLEVAVTKDVHGQIGWKVLEFGASREGVTTQTLTLTLRPLWQRPDGTVTADFSIAVQGAAGQHFGPRRSPEVAPEATEDSGAAGG
ncbi:trypco2 family protein [Geodermatophilus sp. SYSU D00766]